MLVAVDNARRRDSVRKGIELSEALAGDKRQCSDPAMIADAFELLSEVRSSDGDLYRSAHRSVRTLEKCRLRIFKTVGSTYRAIRKDGRLKFGVKIQRIFMAQNIAIQVDVKGRKNTIFELRAPGFTYVNIHAVSDELSLDDSLRSLGFARLEFDNSKQRWGKDLNPPPEVVRGTEILTDGRGGLLDEPLVLPH
jgi:hypothetical protein